MCTHMHTHARAVYSYKTFISGVHEMHAWSSAPQLTDLWVHDALLSSVYTTIAYTHPIADNLPLVAR